MPNDNINPLWEDDSIQFPRLISEIAANVVINGSEWQALLDSMSLEDADLNELFERAHVKWEQAKARII